MGQCETVYLGRLPECDEEDILQLCAGTGRIASVRVGNGSAFIDYYDLDDAKYCIEKLHRIKFKRKEIVAELAHRKGRLPVAPIICFRCGTPGHRSTDCAETGDIYQSKCFHCGSKNHQIKLCPTRYPDISIPENPDSHSRSRSHRDRKTSYDESPATSPTSSDHHSTPSRRRRSPSPKSKHHERHRSLSPPSPRRKLDRGDLKDRHRRSSRSISPRRPRLDPTYYSEDFFAASVPPRTEV